MKRKYLPIGTIVKLKDIEKFAMISGYFPSSSSNAGYVWDYAAFPYPEGMIDNDKVIQFDNESIEKIIVMGYQDESQMAFIKVVSEKSDEIKELGKKQQESKDSEVFG